ncbi:MAG TPA: DNA polymerase Y family protein [Caulobacteraceae bacterium]|jgi:protein ImuB|nr:DNA polymerase Y family protein [Caulobacteraceae bacterium]
MERFLCAWSPNWAIACARRRHPSVSPAEAARPLALVRPVRGARRLHAVDEAAARLGLWAGQTAADATALVPDLILLDADPDADAADLKTLCDWCARLSPAVAPDPPDGLVLEIAGVAHLWGGEGAFLERTRAALAAQGVRMRLAIASTLGAAWALARYGPDGACIAPGEEAAALAELPVAALRCEPQAAAQLARLGIERIGQLADLPRAQLGRRYGPQILCRLDQALGRLAEAASFARPAEAWRERLAFAEPISAPDDLARASRDVAALLCARLETHGQGARAFELSFHGVDNQARRLAVRLALPGRDAERIARLFAPRLETIDPGFGLEAVSLAADEITPTGPRQKQLAQAGRPDAEDGLAPLVDRLTNRLGEAAVWRAAPFASHLPERASTRRPPLEAAAAGAGAFENAEARPLRLLPRPEPVEAVAVAPDDPPRLFRWRGLTRRVRLAEGPERISPEWWRHAFEPEDPAQAIPERDYYRVEDEAGGRFWLFRAGAYGGETPPRWWLHGLFG